MNFRPAAALILVSLPLVGQCQNLLRNPSFEDVPDNSQGQGILPNEWTQSTEIVPGADTYSTDGSYGLLPSDFGNFPGVDAHTGLRFVAASAGFGPIGEAFGQDLSTPIDLNGNIWVSAYIHNSARFDFPGLFAFRLDDASGRIVSSTVGQSVRFADGWQEEHGFIGLGGFAPFIRFNVIAAGFGGDTPYVAFDDVELRRVSVLPPSSFAVQYGRKTAGSLASLDKQGDNDWLKVRMGPTVPTDNSNVAVVYTCPAPNAAPGVLDVDLVSKVSQAGGFVVTVELWDVSAGTWDQATSITEPETTVANKHEIYIRGDVAKYIDPSGDYHVRVRVRPSGPWMGRAWEHWTDAVLVRSG